MGGGLKVFPEFPLNAGIGDSMSYPLKGGSENVNPNLKRLGAIVRIPCEWKVSFLIPFDTTYKVSYSLTFFLYRYL